MNKFGLIGHPIAHSLSPALFKAAYEGRFTYDLIEGDDFLTSYQKFLDEYKAINVTAPFKEDAFRKADMATRECQAIGAANILYKGDDGKIIADNSDHLGVINAVKDAIPAGIKIKPTALIVGCGGAAKAAAYAMCNNGFRTTIINRNLQKAADFAQKLNENPEFEVNAAPLEEFSKHFSEAGVIIYTLPIAIPALAHLSTEGIKIILEANYKDPAFTESHIKALQDVNSRLIYVSGREWLLHQAVGAYKTFTSKAPNIENMRKVL